MKKLNESIFMQRRKGRNMFLKYLARRDMYMKTLICFLVSVSSSFYSMQQIIGGKYSISTCIFTGVFSFFLTTYVFLKTSDSVREYICVNRWTCPLLAILSLFIAGSGYLNKGIAFYTYGIDLPINIFRLRWYMLSVFAIEYYLILLYRDMRSFLSELFSVVTDNIKKTYVIVSFVASFVVLLVFYSNSMWFQMYDHVYGIDSDWVYEIIYKEISYYDIRHPLLGIITFPIYSVISFALKIVSPSNIYSVLLAFFIQIIHIQCILLIGLMIYVMSNKNERVLGLYWLSFPSLFFIFAFEKYQISIFLVVMYVYLYIYDRKRSLISVLMIGAMPTSSLVLVIELLGNKPMVRKLIDCLEIVLMGIVLSIMTGRCFMLSIPQTYLEIRNMHTQFGSGTFSLQERCFAFLNMIRGCFIGLSSIVGETYTWSNVRASPDIMIVFIVAFILIGFYKLRNNKLTKICLLEMLEAFALIVLLNFAPREAPSFSIFFSWAFIILFVEGVDYVCEQIKLNKKKTWAILLVIVFVINISMIFDINQFLKARSPDEVELPVEELLGDIIYPQ